MSRRVRLALATGSVVVAGTAAALLIRDRAPAAAARRPAPAATASARVERRDLVVTEDLAGTLGFGATRPIAGAPGGTYTGLPSAGAVVRRGQALYRVDTRPVVLLYGTVPVWRTLRTGVADGADVWQLERNLLALGFDTGHDMTIDGNFDWATRAAVRRWQRALGRDDTGAVSPSDIVFLPGPRRVASVHATVGSRAAPGAPLLDVTATRRLVTVALDVSSQSTAVAGKRVAVTLPDQRVLAGVIAGIGKVAQTSTDASGSSTTTIDVTVALRPTAGQRIGRLDRAPVSVRLVTASKRRVLAVPVTALVALGNGGFGVEVLGGRAAGYHRVRAGTFAGSWVEVSGGGLRPGVRVAVSQ